MLRKSSFQLTKYKQIEHTEKQEYQMNECFHSTKNEPERWRGTAPIREILSNWSSEVHLDRHKF